MALFQHTASEESTGVDGRLLDIFQSILATDPSSVETHQQCSSILTNLILKHPETIDGSTAHTGWHSLFSVVKLLSPLDSAMSVMTAFSRVDNPLVLLPMAMWEYEQTLCCSLKESPNFPELYSLVRKLHSTLVEWACNPSLLDGAATEILVNKLKQRESALLKTYGKGRRKKLDADLPPLSSLLAESNDYEIFPSELDRDPSYGNDDEEQSRGAVPPDWCGKPEAMLCVWELSLALVEGLCPMLYQPYEENEYPTELLSILHKQIIESNGLGMCS